jgi:hypothetical protein
LGHAGFHFRRLFEGLLNFQLLLLEGFKLGFRPGELSFQGRQVLG